MRLTVFEGRRTDMNAKNAGAAEAIIPYVGTPHHPFFSKILNACPSFAKAYSVRLCYQRTPENHYVR